MTGPLAEVELTILAPFCVGILVAVGSIVILAGFLPLRSERRPKVYWRAGIVFGAALMVAALIVTLCSIALLLPTSVAIIVSGLAVLAGPFLVQPIPESLRDSLSAPIVVIVVSFAAMSLLPNPW